MVDFIFDNEKLFPLDKTVIIISDRLSDSRNYISTNFHSNLVDKYDIIIVIDIFSSLTLLLINEAIDRYKLSLNENGKIIFVEKLRTNDEFNVISLLKNLLFPLTYKDVLMSEMYDILRVNDLFIIDSDRIYSNQYTSFYTIEYFAVICS